jgi:hypothetical protein
MKKSEFYEEYLVYLDWRLNEGQITRGKYSLFKISKNEYDKFIKRLENDKNFNDKFIKILKSENRDKKIDDIIDSDFKKIDDIFDEFDL